MFPILQLVGNVQPFQLVKLASKDQDKVVRIALNRILTVMYGNHIYTYRVKNSVPNYSFKRKAFIVVGLIALVISITLITQGRNTGLASAAGPEFIKRNQHTDPVQVANREQGNELDAYYAEMGKRQSKVDSGGLFPLPQLETSNLKLGQGGRVYLTDIPPFKTEYKGKIAGLSKSNEFVYYTLDPSLQRFAEQLVKSADAPHVAIVAMQPKTGKILAIAEKSNQIQDLSLHSGFPAASLFKIITTAAAIENEKVEPYSLVHFRGGTYTLNKWNYLPDKRRDKRSMTVADALGKSCNAVFGRIALQHLSPNILRQYAERFGFNDSIGFEHPITDSSAQIPESDFELSRTAAGFGDVTISPVHAATLMSGIANGGLLPRPYLVNQVVGTSGNVIYQSRPEVLRRIIAGGTAKTLLQMMTSTTTTGTSRNEFMSSKKRPLLPISVAAKTGTLSGENPKGINHWFVAAAPVNDPEIAISVIVVNPGFSRTKASRLGRQMIEEFLGF